MKRFITFIMIALLLQSCAGGSEIGLKGNYQNPNTFYFDRTESEVWSGLMAVLCDKGLSVKSMDKSSGVIFGDKYDFTNQSSAENAKGQLVSKDAFIVSQYVVFTGTNYILPNQISADWNIRIFQHEGKTAMNVNVKNIVSKYSSSVTIVYEAKSTGNFEKLIADSISF
jgi:hypothetical protein